MELTISFMMAPPSKQTIGSTPPLSSRERLSDALYVRMTQREREVLEGEPRIRGVTCSELVPEHHPRGRLRKGGYQQELEC